MAYKLYQRQKQKNKTICEGQQHQQQHETSLPYLSPVSAVHITLLMICKMTTKSTNTIAEQAKTKKWNHCYALLPHVSLLVTALCVSLDWWFANCSHRHSWLLSVDIFFCDTFIAGHCQLTFFAWERFRSDGEDGSQLQIAVDRWLISNTLYRN